MFVIKMKNCFLPHVVTWNLALGRQVSHGPEQNNPRTINSESITEMTGTVEAVEGILIKI
jgi:hypothetical protein